MIRLDWDGRFNVETAFMALTKYTCPYGHEEEVYREVLDAYGFMPDGAGNFMLQIGESTTMFAAHLDTAGWEKKPLRVKRRTFRQDPSGDLMVGVASNSKGRILGADDRAGLVIVLYLIEAKVPGLYYLFTGEEVGRQGSEEAAKNYGEFLGGKEGIERVIQWDRRGYDSIVTHQSGERGVSSSFTHALTNAYAEHGIDMQPDDGGSYTDSFSWFEHIPECVNLSVGYQHEHSAAEVQNVSFLERLAEASAHIEWDALPTEQDPKDRELAFTFTVSRSYQNRTYRRSLSREPVSRTDLFDAYEHGTLDIWQIQEFIFDDPDAAADLIYDLIEAVVDDRPPHFELDAIPDPDEFDPLGSLPWAASD